MGAMLQWNFVYRLISSIVLLIIQYSFIDTYKSVLYSHIRHSQEFPGRMFKGIKPHV